MRADWNILSGFRSGILGVCQVRGGSKTNFKNSILENGSVLMSLFPLT